jgi:hypothetical protein
LHAQINFYGISNFTEQTKHQSIFKKKLRAGQICPEWAEAAPAQIRPQRAGDGFRLG